VATVINSSDMAVNLDLCLALTAFSCEDSFMFHTYCNTRPLFLRSYPKDPLFSLLNDALLQKSNHYLFKILALM
jgi:hypothetical protein